MEQIFITQMQNTDERIENVHCTFIKMYFIYLLPRCRKQFLTNRFILYPSYLFIHLMDQKVSRVSAVKFYIECSDFLWRFSREIHKFLFQLEKCKDHSFYINTLAELHRREPFRLSASTSRDDLSAIARLERASRCLHTAFRRSFNTSSTNERWQARRNQ